MNKNTMNKRAAIIANRENTKQVTALIDLRDSLLSMRASYSSLVNSMSNVYIPDVNVFIANDYPLEKSFDEINMEAWIDSSTQSIEEELGRRGKDTRGWVEVDGLKVMAENGFLLVKDDDLIYHERYIKGTLGFATIREFMESTKADNAATLTSFSLDRTQLSLVTTALDNQAAAYDELQPEDLVDDFAAEEEATKVALRKAREEAVSMRLISDKLNGIIE